MLRIYRWLLNLYPAMFREEYAGPMEREFRDELAEAPNRAAVVWLWLRLLFDLAVSLPAQFAIEIWRDGKQGFRLWAKRPWQTGFAVVALAVAIGASTGVFSVVNALLLRSLPSRNPDRLAALVHFIPPHDSASQFEEWRTHSSYLEDAGIFEQGDFNIGSADHVMRAHIAQTSWNFFSLLGVQPVIGRTFASRDQGVALLGFGLWQELFAGNERVLGSTVRVDGKPVTIVGVLPPEFNYPGKTVLWTSAGFSRGNNGWRTIARLKGQMNWAQARAAFAADIHRLEPHRKFVSDWIPALIPLRDELAGQVKNASLLLMGGVLLILLIACANVANLMLARTADRQNELSIRSALEASRARLIQQLLTECLLLAFISAALGLVVAFWATSLATKLQPAALPSQTYSILDIRVLAFMAGIAVLSVILFGTLPGLSVGQAHPFTARGSSELRTSRLVRELLVAAQVTLTVVLLTASVSVVKAFSHALQVDHGFKTEGLVTVSVSLDGTRYTSPARQLEYFEETLARVRRLPGVRYASATQFLPLDATGFVGGPYAVDGHPSKPGTATDIIPIMSDYFAATSGHLRYGREFTDAEVRSDARVTIVNDTFAKLSFGTTDVLGHMVTDAGDRTRKIIGVVNTVDFMEQWISDIFDVNPPEIFVPEHSPTGFPSTLVVHVNGRPESHLAMIRDVVQSVDRTVPIFGVKTMQQRMDEAFARPKLYRTAVLFFAAFALLLAVTGIYAVVSYAVAQRTHEMGIRLALGTTPMRLRKRLLDQGLISVVSGALCGIVGALLATRVLGSLIEGASSFDPMAYVAAMLFMFLIASLSIWTATHRITRMDVVEILRAE
jgi:predicted permease